VEYFQNGNLLQEIQLKVEYFFVAKTSNLIPVKQIEKEKFHRIFVAVFAGKTRLIDTVELGIL
jgi:pantothenate synthetase